MADPKRVGVDSGGLQGVASLLDLLGGQKGSSTTTSDTSALSGILGNLQGTDYEKVLQSIFQQAGGAIPGLTAGLSNSVGARTGGNSAVSTALGKLLESTVMKAADRTAQLTQNNQQLQVQAAQGIANGNKQTNSTSGTNTGKAAQNLAILQLGSKLLNSGTGKGLVAKGKGLFDSVFGDSATPGADLGSASFNFDQAAPAQFTDAGFNFGSADVGGGFGGLGDAAAGGGSFLDGVGGGDVAGTVAGGATDIPTDFVDFGDFFADGGLVGRDNKPISSDGDKPDEGYAEQRAWEMDDGDFPNSAQTKLPSHQAGSPQTLTMANGGVVRSGGGRRSSAPTYDPQRPETNAAVQSPRSALNPAASRRNEDVSLGPLTLDSGPGQESNPTSIGSIDPAQSVAVGNAVGNAVGAATMSAVVGPIGMAAINGTSSLTGVSTPQSALSQAISAIANALGIGSDNGTASEAVGDSGPAGSSGMSAAIGGIDGISGTSADSAADNAGASDSGTSGDGATSGAGGVGVGDSGTGYSTGGKVNGPGSGTSDSIPARLSAGEYVIPADVVQSLGVQFFDELKNHFHTPAAVQNGR